MKVPLLIALAAPTLLVLLALGIAVDALATEHGASRQRLWLWTMGAFVVHLALGLLLFKVGQTTFFPSDAGTYDGGARQILAHWTRGLPFDALPSGKEGFFYLLAGLYRVLGPYAESGLVVNAALAAALVPVVTDTARRLFGPPAARYVAPLVVLLPGLLLWTSGLLREAGVCFLIAVAGNAAVRLTSRISPQAVVALTLALALLFTFRGNVALIVAGGLVAGVAFGRAELVSGLSTGLGAMAILLLVVAGLGLGYSGYKKSVNADLGQVETVRSDLSTSASGFAPEADVSTTGGALSYLPLGFTSFFLGPFPWQLQSARQLVALPDVLVWWYLLPSLVRGIRSGRIMGGRRILVLVVPALMAGLMLSLLIGNFGTVIRERVQVTVLLVPFIALGLAVRAPPTEEDTLTIVQAPVPVTGG
ncbi:MAG: hypothetical protein ACR2G7_09350 [Acidimicrobiales bacterium]